MDIKVLFLIVFVFSLSVNGRTHRTFPPPIRGDQAIIYHFDDQGRNIHIDQDGDDDDDFSQNANGLIEPRMIVEDEPENKFIPKIDPSKCAGETFCEEADYYPYNEVGDKLAEAGEGEYKYIFGIDDIQLATKMDMSGLKKDEDDAEDGIPVTYHSTCDSSMRIIFPRIAKNKDNNWKYVVNQGVEKVQGIAIEWCSDNGSKCNHLTTINKSMFSTCGQKYSYRRLLTVSHEGVLESDIFEFPVACVCLVKSYRY